MPRFVAQTLWEEFLQAKWAGEILTKQLWKQNRRVHPEGIVNKDLRYVSPNFPPIDNGQRSHALGFHLRDCILDTRIIPLSILEKSTFILGIIPRILDFLIISIYLDSEFPDLHLDGAKAEDETSCKKKVFLKFISFSYDHVQLLGSAHE